MSCIPMRILKLLILFLFTAPAFGAVTANFTADFTSGCAPLVVHFTNTSTGATSYSWNLGNSTTSVATNPSTSYLTVGTFTVTLTASDGTSSSTRTMVITVYPPPSVSFYANDTEVCPGATVLFTNTSTGGVPGPMTYLWNFGDGGISTAAAPAHTYATPGHYNVALSVTNSQGCVRTVTRMTYVEVIPGPAVNFWGTPLIICNPPATVTFANTTTGALPLSYVWSFGSASPPSTALAPTVSYTMPGSYPVKLVVTDGNGCIDSLARVAYINVFSDTARFTGPLTACPRTSVTFINTSSTHTTRTWYFGDGGLSTALHGTHTYAAPGVYNVRLVITNGACSDTFSQNITILTPGSGTFTITPTDPCPPPVTMTYTSSVGLGSSVQWIYEGGTGTGAVGAHHYTTPGVKTVKMVVTDAMGCIDTVTQKDTLYDGVLVAAAAPISGCVPLTVNFNLYLYTTMPDSAIHAYPFPITSYSWGFGDGGSSSGGPTNSHTYTAVGTYVATVSVTTSNGCTFVDTITIVVGAPPVVEFTATPTHICYGDSVFFTATVISGPISGFIWEFGDATIATVSPYAVHRYTIPGVFTVTLTGVYNGCEGPPFVWTVPITVDSPKAIISYSTVCTPLTRVFFADSSLGATTRMWIFGDGGTSTATNPVHDYPALGTYTVTLATHNIASGCRDTTERVVILQDPSVTLAASDTAVCKGDVVNFTTTVVGGSMSGYRWFVDGVHDPWQTGASLLDTFYTPGYHTIMLVTFDSRGCRDTIRKVDWIVVGDPRAGFMVTPPVGCWRLTITGTDTSTDVSGVALSSYTWDFGDGSIVTTTSPTVVYTYTTPGTYTVTTVVTDNIGCMDTATFAPVVVRRPTADFNTSNTNPCIGAPTTFNNTSSGAVSYIWHFGDGATSTAVTPAHAYADTGSYTVRLIAIDAFGCRDTMTLPAYVRVTKPRAAFNMSDTFSICPPLLVNFTNTSTGATSYSWDFGDGNISALTNPSNMYMGSGLIPVRLIAINSYGCRDTAYRNLNLYGYAGAFTYTPLFGCAPLTVHFDAGVTNVTSLIWDFGDGSTASTSLVDTTSHVYTLPGSYVPKLILSDGTGCQNSSVGLDTIKVDELKADMGVTPSACIGIPFYLVDSSTWMFSPVNYRLWTIYGDTTTAASPSFTADSAGTYTFTLEVRNVWGCVGTTTEDIIVHPSPVIYTGPDTVVCVGDPATLTGYGANTYVWSGPAVSCPTCNPTTATVNTETTYTVVGTDGYGCKDTAQSRALIRTHTIANAWGDSAICEGGQVQIFDTGGHTYVWLPNAGLSSNTVYNPFASPGSTITYTVIAQLGGCIPDTDYVNVDVFPGPRVDAGIDQQVMAGTLVTLTASGTNIATYLWSPKDDLTCYNCRSTDVRVSQSTTFLVEATSTYGCKAYDSVRVYLFCSSQQVFLPNVFTPNNDGENDVFYPRGSGISLIKSFRIYNRWGELLFQSNNFMPNDPNYAWDGTYQGDGPKPDVYVYVVDAVCSTGQPVLIKGDVTIVR